jgi:regulator of sigma E protease
MAVYIVIAIVIFGSLIAIHEFGHFLAAKRLGVKVNEFAIGMGPKILSKQGKETLYAWRLLPIGGACVMEGEDTEAESSRSFTAQPRWKRVIILAAGAFFNFVAGFIVILVISMTTGQFAGTTVVELQPGFPGAGADGISVGDTIVSINGEHLYYYQDFSTFMEMPNATDGVVDLVLRRDGEKITLKDFPLARREYTVDGETVYKFGITFNLLEANIGQKLKYSGYLATNFVRLVRVGLVQLVSGAAGIKDMSGPVGIVSVISDVGNTPGASASDKAYSIAFLAAFIAVNLAVMNLLPIPALDGGRIFALIVTFVIEKIIRRRVDPKYEGYVHAAGLVLLLGLMAVIMVSDVLKLIRG